MNYKYVLAIDPSGSYEEGQGITGWCLIETKSNKIRATGFLNAGNYLCAPDYWDAHINLIENWSEDLGPQMIVVIEDYVLYADKARSQINSKMETCRVIGVMQHFCYTQDIAYTMQLANLVVNRWNNNVLLHKGIIVKLGRSYALPKQKDKVNRHVLDAIRHGTHYTTFKNGKEK